MENMEIKELVRFYEQHIRKLDASIEVMKSKIGEREFDELQYMYKLGLRDGYKTMLEEIKELLGGDKNE